MIDRRTGPRFALGRLMMVLLLLFALLPMFWSVILTFRPKLVLFEPIWESPLNWSLDNFAALARSRLPRRAS